MPTPGWLQWMLAAAMVAVALYHLARLAAARRPDRVRPSVQINGPVHPAPIDVDHPALVHVDVEFSHAAMGAGMTVMVLNAVAPAGLRGLGLVFVAAMLWFGSRAVHSYATDARGADVSARQVIGCAAMAYMLLVLAAPSAVAGTMTGAMNGMSVSHAGSSIVTTLSAPVFRALFAGATLCVAGWIVRLRVRSVDAGPALSLGCQLAVSVTTVYMLVAM